MTDTESPLPNGWARTSIGEIRRDVTASLDPALSPNEFFDLYSIPAHDAHTFEHLPGREIGSTKKLLTRGTVVLSKLNPRISRVGVVGPGRGFRQLGSSEWIPLSPVDGIDPQFLAYALRRESVRTHLASNVSGVGGSLMRTNASVVDVMPFMLPPCEEQRRIVEAIESYVSRLDAAVAGLEKAQARVTAYRASVLKAAIEGRLVPTEAELARAEKRDYEPAKLLLKRILAERRSRWEEAESAKLNAVGKPPRRDKPKTRYQEPVTPDSNALPSLPDGWFWASLDQIITEPLTNGKSVPDGGGFPVLRLTAITGRVVTLSERKTGTWDGVNPGPFTVKLNDFLIVRGNGSLKLVGRAGRVVSEPDPIAYPDTLIRARVASDALSPTLLSRFWDSSPVRRHIERRAKTTAGIYKVNQSDLRQTPLPLPPLNEQLRIADELERLDSVGAIMLRDVSRMLDRCRRLRQAVLKWAFEGKLVDQDPSDEPAENLLERIRTERDSKATVKRPRYRGATANS